MQERKYRQDKLVLNLSELTNQFLHTCSTQTRQKSFFGYKLHVRNSRLGSSDLLNGPTSTKITIVTNGDELI